MMQRPDYFDALAATMMIRQAEGAVGQLQQRSLSATKRRIAAAMSAQAPTANNHKPLG
jgi:hypothetical protein